jgi:NAD/NADP transhydrogenase beta subunit
VSRETLINLLYLFSATTFVVALKGLGSPKHARQGNMVAAFGMTVIFTKRAVGTATMKPMNMASRISQTWR